MIIIYSGIIDSISEIENLIRRLDEGMVIHGVLFTAFGRKLTDEYVEMLRRIKEYGIFIMMDSGAHSFLSAKDAMKGRQETIMGHKASGTAMEIIENDKYDEYVDGLIESMRKVEGIVDCVVELDLQALVGKMRVQGWRNRFREAGINTMYVWHGESTKEVAWWAKKTDYIGIGGADKLKTRREIGKVARSLRTATKGKWVHGFALTDQEVMKQSRNVITSVDSTSWMSSSRFGLVYYLNGKGLSTYAPGKSKVIKKTAMRTILRDAKKYHIAGVDLRKIQAMDWKEMDFWNIAMFETWLKINNVYSGQEMNIVKKKEEIVEVDKRAGYEKAMSAMEDAGEEIPHWAKEKDKFGRPKTIYLRSRWNAMKSGAFAKVISKYATMCDSCPVMDKCPQYERGSVCFFLPYWRTVGNTRNKDAVMKVIEGVIAEKSFRYKRARFHEDLEGGLAEASVTNMENDLLKALDMYAKLKFGTLGGDQNIRIKDSSVKISVGVDDVLSEVREEYGDELTGILEAKIKKKKRKVVDVEAEDVGE